MPWVTGWSRSTSTAECPATPACSISSPTVPAVDVISCATPSMTTATGFAVRTVTVSPLDSFSPGAG